MIYDKNKKYLRIFAVFFWIPLSANYNKIQGTFAQSFQGYSIHVPALRHQFHYSASDVKNLIGNPRADGAKRRARVLIPPGYLHPGKGKH